MTASDIVASTDMVAFCFQVLIHKLRADGQTLAIPLTLPAVNVGGMFVTWETSDGNLRGCIGSLSELPLSDLEKFSLRASLEDSRFAPISISEVPGLVCHVSILHSFEKCNGARDWTIGVHGITVEFVVSRRVYRATFLPQVMSEQRWTKDEAVKQAVRKSGFNGSLSEVREMLEITRYQSSKASMSYAEFSRLHDIT
jgi:uncharacterized protein (TIGR00296 family)